MTKPRKSNDQLAGYEAECGVLGALIADDRLFPEYGSRLSDDDFADDRHKTIFAAIKRLVERGQRVTRPALLAELNDDTSFSPYLAALFAGAPEGSLVGDLLDLVLALAGRRRIVAAADEIRDRVTKAPAGASLDEITQDSIRIINGARTEGVKDSSRLGDVAAEVISRAYDVQKSGKPLGIRTGLAAYDELVGPGLPGHLIVIGGETGMGKTALGVTLATKLAEQGIPGHITSLEMDDDEIAARVLSAKSAVQSEEIVTGTLSAADLDRVFGAGEVLIDLPLWIDDQPRQSALTIEARLTRAKAKHGIRFAMIDHLQFMADVNPREEERVRVARRVEDVKAMAKRLELLVFLISHVSRVTDAVQVRTAADIRRPMLRDLYGSSAIEKAADAVVFVHRPVWHLERASVPEKYKGDWQLDMVRWTGKAELVMPKRRGGKGFGVSLCRFDEERTWFRDEEMTKREDMLL